MSNAIAKVRPSKITIPLKANPFARLVFGEMARQGVTYEELEWRSNVLISTFKAWRHDNRPGLETIQAALGALGWDLIPVPRCDRLPENVQEGLEALRDLWKRDEPLLHHFLAACTGPHRMNTKMPGGSRCEQAVKVITRKIKSGVKLELAQPLSSKRAVLSAVTVRLPKAKANGGGDFKINRPLAVSDVTQLRPSQIALLSAHDTARILRVADAMQATSTAVPVLAEFAEVIAEESVTSELELAA